MQKVTPRPALVTGDGPYNLVEKKPGTGGYCSHGAHILGVPLDKSNESFAIRAHELAHLAVHENGYFDHNVFRKEMEGLGITDFRWYNAALDLVVNTYCIKKSITEILYLDAGVDDLRTVDDREFAELFIRLHGTSKAIQDRVASPRLGPFVYSMLHNLKMTVDDGLAQRLVGARDTERFEREVAAILARVAGIFTGIEKEKERESGDNPEGKETKIDLDGKLKRLGACDTYEDSDVLGGPKILRGGYYGSAKFIPPGEMMIKTFPLSKRLTIREGQGITSRPFGSVPNRTWRMPPLGDGRIFAMGRNAHRGKNGTLLIDVSGSMHVEYSHIAAILKEKPLATIAFYSGAAQVGYLCIVARDGRVISEGQLEKICGLYFLGCNVIDLPALRWLGKQLEPRIWVCDGGVTGINDAFSDTMSKLCKVEVLKNRVKQVMSVGAYLGRYEDR